MSQATPTNPIGPHETAAEIEQAAAAWVARVDRGPLSADEEEELKRWAAADNRRAGAYARAMAANLHLDRMAALGDNFPVSSENVQAPMRRRVMAVAAGAVFASATGIGIFTFGRRDQLPAAQPIATVKGGMREYALQEGSQITLNTMTQVRPMLTNSVRRIDLDRGEALFHVSKDPSRPFIVYVGEIGVRAIGTIFSVRRLADDSIRLLVTEGVVEVTRGSDVLGRVHAGIEFMLDAATSPVITTLDPTRISSALAWRQGRIDLQGMTLGEAVEEFSRYSDLKIKVDDPTIAGLHITGVYATDDPQGFAQNAALSLGLKSVRRGNVVTISKS